MNPRQDLRTSARADRIKAITYVPNMSLSRRLQGAWSSLRQRIWKVGKDDVAQANQQALEKPSVTVLNEYVDSTPSPQNAVDLVPGWNNALPPQAGATAGMTPFYADPRIEWCIEQFGDLAGRRVLELGPLEASHTYMLCRHSPDVIHAVEANKLSFMRCLVAKELLGLDRARFMLGDFEKWLEATDQHYDLIVASGVLYHMREPTRLIELIARRCASVYLWTHYFCKEAMPPGDVRRGAFSGRVDVRRVADVDVRLHERSYHEAWRNKTFCGGMYDRHYWMEKTDIIRLLQLGGFDMIEVAHELTDHANGPCMSVFARKSI